MLSNSTHAEAAPLLSRFAIGGGDSLRRSRGSTGVEVSEVQRSWAAKSVHERVAVIGRARRELAALTMKFAEAVSSELARTPADTIVAEVLPMLAAARFLEKEAARVLEPKRWGVAGRPFWLAGVRSEVRRVAFGTVLIIGPGNYPLFLPGVQAMQALVAGNAVVWKPGRGGAGVARLFAEAFERGGLPSGLLRVTAETVEAGQATVAEGVDKVFFTGSAAAGRAVLRDLAQSLTPAVVELSGCDAVVVLPGADLGRVVKALAFGMRLNGSATCMAPRRVLLVDMDAAERETFLGRLQQALAEVPGVALGAGVRSQLRDLLREAVDGGATVVGDAGADRVRPIVVLGTRPEMEMASADLFAPVLMILDTTASEISEVVEASPLALTVSIFGPERQARKLADQVTAGTVLINDLIVPTADPRLPFGGRRGSGFGVTRGREGLLEMTAVKVVSVQRGKSTRHFEPTGEAHAELFHGLASAAHAGSWTERWSGLRQIFAAANRLKK